LLREGDEMSNRRSATRRDLPALCLLYSVIFALAAIGLPFGAKLDMARKDELRSITGIVQDTSRTNLSKAGPKLHIFVRDGDRVFHLTQDDLSNVAPAVCNLRAGDNVTALVRRDFLGRDLEWVWEVRRDGVTLLSYEQTERYLEQSMGRMKVIAVWAGVISIGLLGLAIRLRTHFGAWSEGMRQSVQSTTLITPSTR
jgi:hypothetical protein